MRSLWNCRRRSREGEDSLVAHSSTFNTPLRDKSWRRDWECDEEFLKNTRSRVRSLWNCRRRSREGEDSLVAHSSTFNTPLRDKSWRRDWECDEEFLKNTRSRVRSLWNCRRRSREGEDSLVAHSSTFNTPLRDKSWRRDWECDEEFLKNMRCFFWDKITCTAT